MESLGFHIQKTILSLNVKFKTSNKKNEDDTSYLTVRFLVFTLTVIFLKN